MVPPSHPQYKRTADGKANTAKQDSRVAIVRQSPGAVAERDVDLYTHPDFVGQRPGNPVVKGTVE